MKRILLIQKAVICLNNNLKGMYNSSNDELYTPKILVEPIIMDDNYIRLNPTDNTLRELKQAHNFSAEKRKV